MGEGNSHPETVGPFAIESELGRGGMGVVYLGRDERLGRRVAIKVLPNTFPTEEMSLRFEREARTAAQLNHANIATIHEIGRDGDTTYIAMEYVEGRSLHDVINKRALHARDMLRIARTIAEGLAAAHARGIVHRDIKPGNIIVDGEGSAKILDFGLAKPMAGAIEKSSFSDTMVTAALENLSERMTVRGQVMGTVAYMSPEQAKGAEVDHRTDIFSLGVVMYEMAAGRPPFEGDTSVTTIAKIIESEPKSIGEVNPNLPPDVERIINRCIRKHPSERYQSAADLAHDLQDAERAVAELSTRTLMAGGGRLRKQGMLGWGHVAAGVAVGALATAVVVGLLPMYKSRDVAPARQVHLGISARHMVESLGVDSNIARFYDIELSPDGSEIALRLGGRDQPLYIRELDSLEYRRIPGTENARGTRFSPDGQWLLYFQDGHIRRSPANGGPALTVAELDEIVVTDESAVWLPDNTIIFAAGPIGLFRVPVTGGVPELIATPDPSRKLFGFDGVAPAPGRTDVVLASMWTGLGVETYSVVAVSLEDGSLRVVYDRAANPHVSANGHFFFQRDATMLRAPMDMELLTVTGEPTTLIDGVDAGVWGGESTFGITDNGDYYFMEGMRYVADRNIIRIAPDGTVTDTGLPRDDYAFYLSASPVDDRLAVSILTRELEMWVLDVATGARTRIVSGYESYSPVWSPDGARIAYTGEIGSDDTPLYSASTVFVADLTRDGAPLRLELPEAEYYPQDWSPDGDLLLLSVRDRGLDGDVDLMAWSFTEAALSAVVATENNEYDAQFSPDGAWIVYETDESGQTQVYVRAFPNDGRRWQVSREADIADGPHWSHDGAHIYWVHEDALMRASFSAVESVRIGAPEVVARNEIIETLGGGILSVTKDGDFIAIAPPEHHMRDSFVHIVLNPEFAK